MKLLFIGLFLIPILCFSQSKGDTRVVVSVSDSSDLFNRVALFLVERGYTLDRKDKEVGYITTQPKKLSKWWPDTKVTAVIKGSQLILSGFADVSGELTLSGLKSSGTFDPIVYVGKNNIMRNSWNELVAIGKEFGGVSYLK